MSAGTMDKPSASATDIRTSVTDIGSSAEPEPSSFRRDEVPLVEVAESGKSEPSRKAKPEKQEFWTHRKMFLFAVVGQAIGLGNIFRFPLVAYRNGGSAFFIPYIVIGLVFGFPVLYAEMLIGQLSRTSAARAYCRLSPAFEGLGCFSAIQSFMMVSFCTIMVGWSLVSLASATLGQPSRWMDCDGDDCIPTTAHIHCYAQKNGLIYAQPDGSCGDRPANGTYSGAIEHFKRGFYQPSGGFFEMGEMNGSLAGAVLLVCLVLFFVSRKGIRYLQWVFYVTTPVPFVIGLFFVDKSVVVQGGWRGLCMFLRPDFSKLYLMKTWKVALKQVCYSLSLGASLMTSMASHNRPDRNVMNDAARVLLYDLAMSLIGGIVVFGTLGTYTRLFGHKIKDYISSDPLLLYAYFSEAMLLLPGVTFFLPLLFIMILILSFGTTLAAMEYLVRYVADGLLSGMERGKRTWAAGLLCFTLAFLGVLLSTGGGYYWFHLLSDSCLVTGPIFGIALELIQISWFYGWENLSKDMERMWGEKPSGWYELYFSRFSPLFGFSWMAVGPILAITLVAFTVIKAPFEVDGQLQPNWTTTVGWLMDLGPLVVLPIYFVRNWLKYRGQGIAFKYLFMPTMEMPSAKRYYAEKGIPQPGMGEPMEEVQMAPTQAATPATKD